MRLGHRFGTARPTLHDSTPARHRGARRLLALALYASGFGVAMLANTAFAIPCQSSADCPVRFRCEAVGETGCAAPPVCPDGGTCASSAPCQAGGDVNVCVSPSCRGDSDCPNDMNCYRSQNGASCIPRYLAACQRDDDCGEGFSCKELISTHCPSGASGASGSAACSTRRTGHYQCELESKTCSDASECPSNFSCGPKPSTMACADADDDAGIASACAGDVCLPPYAAVDFALSDLTAPSSYDPNAGHQSSGPGYRENYRHTCAVTAPGSTAALPAWLAGLGVALIFGRLRRRRRS
jgi:MYXO-CTERM domain-containing protein